MVVAPPFFVLPKTQKIIISYDFFYQDKMQVSQGYINIERAKNDDLIQRRIYVNDMQDDSG